jgi:hypothetical protein
VLLAGVGAIGRPFGWVMLTTTLGPTAHLLLAHPDSVGARLRSAVLDHAAAIVAGPGRLAALGLWAMRRPPPKSTTARALGPDGACGVRQRAGLRGSRR